MKNDAMSESDLQRTCEYHICPRDSKITTNIGFINWDDDSMRETQWTCFYVKDSKSFYFEIFGGCPDQFLHQQLPKPITFHNFEIQDIVSRICVTYSLYFFYLIKRMNCYNAVIIFLRLNKYRLK